MAKSNIEIDSYASFIDGGIGHAVYVGNEDTPSVDEFVDFYTLFFELIDSHSIPSDPPKMKPEHVKDVMEEMTLLRTNFDEAYAQAIEEIQKRTVE